MPDRGSVDHLSGSQARRIALAAQGFTDKRPAGNVDLRHLRRVVNRVGVIQIDSVNVVARTQDLLLFARLGPHARDLIPRASANRELFEYWGHEASHLPPAMHPLLRWRMERAKHGETWGHIARIGREERRYVEAILDEVREGGPLTPSMLTDPGVRTPGMWGRSPGKAALEYLFWTGQVSARRTMSFERWYDLPERILPPEVLAAPTPNESDAHKELLVLAARSMGVATARDLADYHRLNVPRVRPLVDELVEDGCLRRVDVEGWRDPGFLHPDATLPRWVRARALLSPFDSLIWERARTERIWGFRYRLEIYVPPPKRVDGYYVLPFLLGDDLVARVDLKADRQRRTLLVQSSRAEDGVADGHVAAELADELTLMAGWLDLESVTVKPKGDFAGSLAAAVRARR